MRDKCVGRSISSNLVDDACDRLLLLYFGGCFIEAILSAQSDFLRSFAFNNCINCMFRCPVAHAEVTKEKANVLSTPSKMIILDESAGKIS